MGARVVRRQAGGAGGRPFFPQFVLASHDFSKSYQDRIIPAAKKPIEEREMQGRSC